MNINDCCISIEFYGGPCDGVVLKGVPMMKVEPVIHRDGWQYHYEEEPKEPPKEKDWVDDYQLHYGDTAVIEKVGYLGDYRPWYVFVGPSPVFEIIS